MSPNSDDPVALLKAWTGGDARALDALMPLVYGELRRLARTYLRRERPDHTLQTTALVHEAYLRLIGQRQVDWHNRNQLIGLAAQMMRRILVKHAVTRNAVKRGSGHHRAPLTEAMQVAATTADAALDVVALDTALKQLESLDPRQSRIVELRYFGGLTVDETADVLGISTATVKREWQLAKVWLYRALTAGGASLRAGKP